MKPMRLWWCQHLHLRRTIVLFISDSQFINDNNSTNINIIAALVSCEVQRQLAASSNQRSGGMFDNNNINNDNILSQVTLPTCLGLPAAPPAQLGSPLSPAIPKTALDKIRNGEFVKFDTLLPNHSPVTQDEYTFKFGEGSSPSVSLVPKHQSSPKVVNFNSWIQA